MMRRARMVKYAYELISNEKISETSRETTRHLGASHFCGVNIDVLRFSEPLLRYSDSSAAASHAVALGLCETVQAKRNPRFP